MNALAKCRFGCKVNVTVEGELTPVVYRQPIGNGYADYCQLEPVKIALPYLVWCREHRTPMQGKLIRAMRTDKPCSASCMHSASADCKCSCGGANHGIF